MTKEIILDWFGPISITDGITEKAAEIADGPGIYAWVYRPEYFGKVGIYFGESKNMAGRIMNHFSEMVLGGYWVPRRGEPEFYDFQGAYPSERNLPDMLERFDRVTEHLKEDCAFYFARIAPDPDTIRKEIEGILIRAYQHGKSSGLLNVIDTQKTTRPRRPTIPYKIWLKGDNPVIDLFGSWIEWDGNSPSWERSLYRSRDT